MTKRKKSPEEEEWDELPEEERRQFEEGLVKSLESKGKSSTPYKRENEEYLQLKQRVFNPPRLDSNSDEEDVLRIAFDESDLRGEAEKRGDHETLDALDIRRKAQLAEGKRMSQSPSRRLGEDMVEDQLAREDPEHVRFVRLLSRPFWFPRALRKRVGQERCKRCGRWGSRCTCSGKAAEQIKVREREELDKIDKAAAEAERDARKDGTAVRKRKRKKVWGPYTEADLPEAGTYEYNALLVGLFAGRRTEEWRASWTLPEEVWTRLEAEYKALK